MINDLRALPGAAQSLILIAAGVLVFVAALVLIRSGVVSWDERLFTMLNTGTGSGSVGAKVVSAITTPIALVILVVGAGFAVNRVHGSGAILVSAVAAAFGWALANGAKLLIDRPRPYLSLSEAILRQDPARGTSFPSSHTAIVTAVVVALLPLLPRPWRVVGIIVILVVAWSRMYFGVHHPLDLLGGVGMGMAAAGLAWLIVGSIARAW
ncbi:MAG TPA: phosphatase PAP2 family protein [Actinomycetota bacterium]|nr:phosphatase PAP2 family protein [Actinomycetota bacterium]